MTRPIQVGDVFRAPSGKIRIVRHASSKFVTFTIQHCSWTGRPTTTYVIAELEYLGYKLLKRRVPLRSRFDKLMAEDALCLAYPAKLNFKCCDVRGIP